MYAIETELGRFEGTTEREAKQALRKAKREAKIKSAKRAALADIARQRARAMGFNILSAVVQGRKFDHWCIETVGQNSTYCQRVASHSYRFDLLGEVFGITADGIETITHCAVRPNGEVSAVKFASDEFLYAVGACVDVVVFERLPTVKLEFFA